MVISMAMATAMAMATTIVIVIRLLEFIIIQFIHFGVTSRRQYSKF